MVEYIAPNIPPTALSDAAPPLTLLAPVVVAAVVDAGATVTVDVEGVAVVEGSTNVDCEMLVEVNGGTTTVEVRGAVSDAEELLMPMPMPIQEGW